MIISTLDRICSSLFGRRCPHSPSHGNRPKALDRWQWVLFGDWGAAVTGAIKTIIPNKGWSRVSERYTGTVILAELTCLRFKPCSSWGKVTTAPQLFERTALPTREMWGRGGYVPTSRRVAPRDNYASYAINLAQTVIISSPSQIPHNVQFRKVRLVT